MKRQYTFFILIVLSIFTWKLFSQILVFIWPKDQMVEFRLFSAKSFPFKKLTKVFARLSASHGTGKGGARALKVDWTQESNGNRD